MSEAEAKEFRLHEELPRLPVIPTGSLGLDLALAAGRKESGVSSGNAFGIASGNAFGIASGNAFGIAGGQFVEISGSESSGKTTLCQHIVAQAQQLDRSCAWIDVDRSFNPEYAARCGVALEKLLYTSPVDAEQALDTLERLVDTQAGMLVVLDSVEALTPRDELCLPLGANSFAAASNKVESLLSLMLRKATPIVHHRQAIVLLTNRPQQQRSEAYHQLSTNLARLALTLHAGLHLRLKGNGQLLENGIITGQKVQLTILKSKNIPSPQRVEFDIIYNQGINHSGEVFDLGLQAGFIIQHEETYTFQGLDLGNGRRKAIETFERLRLVQPMEQALRQKLLGTPLFGET